MAVDINFPRATTNGQLKHNHDNFTHKSGNLTVKTKSLHVRVINLPSSLTQIKAIIKTQGIFNSPSNSKETTRMQKPKFQENMLIQIHRNRGPLLGSSDSS